MNRAIVLTRIPVIIFCFSFLMGMIAKAQKSFTPYSAEVAEPIEMVPVEGGTVTLAD